VDSIASSNRLIFRPDMRQRPQPIIPLWFRLAYTGFVAVLVPLYSVGYGFANFLWFSNVALLSTVLTVWLRWRLLASMQLVAVGLFELVWAFGFAVGLLRGGDAPLGIAQYMFDEQIDLHLRLLSLYHLFLPWVLLWLVWRLGYDRRAWWAQTLLGWAVLLVCYFFTDPAVNINWTFGPGEGPQQWLPPWLFLLLIMIALPVLVYLPTHRLLLRLVRSSP
jgi:hypothetical protein